MIAEKRGDFVCKVIEVHGIRTATVQRVESVKRGVVVLSRARSMAYCVETGREIDPAFPLGSGISSWICMLDGGEAERLKLANLGCW